MPTELRDSIKALMGRARTDLSELVAMRSVADARQFPQEECDRAADYVMRAFADAGVQGMRLIDMPLGHSAIYGHTPAPPGAPTVLLYSHYDVQPPLGEESWETPSSNSPRRTAAGTAAVRRTAKATSLPSSPPYARSEHRSPWA